ncbi:proline-rich receptor-like protein kinase PERK12 [Bidens hawaiensis]|uniref:proline-rich receptor-like protein kinase PERK12 n=1 Tax=Bidens hawaiensis TaxID=980011 RepID=UPI0040494CA8
MNEKIIVYEHASNGRLNQHLDDPSLTWIKRLKICIDIANGLLYLHGGGGMLKDSMKHRDIKSGSILLDDCWNAKISNLELSQKTTVYDRAEHVDDNGCDSLGYIDPCYQLTGFLTEDSHTYSLGVILIEMLCGRLAWPEGCEDHSHSLAPLAVEHYYEKGTLDEMVFGGIKEQIVPQSLATFQQTAIDCLEDDRPDRPWMNKVVMQLTKALELQESYEAWEHRVLIDYKETTHSPILEIHDGIMKKDLYDMFSRGSFRQDDGVENKKDSLHISLEAIKLSTQNFSDCKVIGEGRFWKLYEGEFEHANECTTIVAKRWDPESRQRHVQFLTELEILHSLLKYNHENIIGFVGYCIEMNEKAIVYEHVSNRSLSKYLGDPSLAWMKRLKICIDIANGLEFLHFSGVERFRLNIETLRVAAFYLMVIGMPKFLIWSSPAKHGSLTELNMLMIKHPTHWDTLTGLPK